MLTTNVGTTTTYFVGNYYKLTGSEVTKYYGFYPEQSRRAGSQRIAMRKNGTLTLILGDHLGSTSLVTDDEGTVISETKYKAWGETRYSTGTEQTKYTYTGQYSYTNDFGLMYYGARWYDSSLGRFAQADSITPNGVQGWDRYAYVNNAPLKYTDPSGNIPIDCLENNGYCGSVKDTKTVLNSVFKPTLTPKPKIVTRNEWGAHPPGSIGNQSLEGLYPNDPTGYMPYSGNLSDTYYMITIHHEGDDATYNPISVQEAEMNSGYYDIAYHYIIGPDGTIYEGRPISVRGAHAVPNTGNVGILWLGDFNPGYDIADPLGRYGQSDPTDDINGPTAAQYSSTVDLIVWLDSQYGIDELYGHGELKNYHPVPGANQDTSCPGLYAMPFVESLKPLINR